MSTCAASRAAISSSATSCSYLAIVRVRSRTKRGLDARVDEENAAGARVRFPRSASRACSQTGAANRHGVNVVQFSITTTFAARVPGRSRVFKQPPRRAVVFDHIFLLKTYERLTNNYHRPRRRASLAYARYSTGLRVTRARPRRSCRFLESAFRGTLSSRCSLQLPTLWAATFRVEGGKDHSPTTPRLRQRLRPTRSSSRTWGNPAPSAVPTGSPRNARCSNTRTPRARCARSSRARRRRRRRRRRACRRRIRRRTCRGGH